jgi:hypothetical protein
LADERNLDALARFGVDAVAVEEIEFVRSGREPDFAESVVFKGEVEFAVMAEDFDGEGVKEFVGEDDEGSGPRKGAVDASGASLWDLVALHCVPSTEAMG